MIVYSNGFWGLPILFRLYGSAFPRSLFFASSSAMATAMLYYYGTAQVITTLKNPFAYQIFGSVVGFALVFRSSLSYQRFWEARTTVQIIMGRLTVFTIQAITQDIWSLDVDKMSQEDKKLAYEFYADLIHYVSLLFSLMLRHLRKDFDLEDYRDHSVLNKAPDLGCQDSASLKLKIQTFFFQLLPISDVIGVDINHQESSMYVIGGLNEDERQILQEPIDCRELEGRGSSLQSTRVFCVYAWIVRLMTKRMASPKSGLKSLPPQYARLLGSLEEAMAGFGQANKLANTQFPFPWAQVVMSFLIMMVCTLPFVVVTFLSEAWMGIMMSFITVMTYWSLNEVASEMEDPFGYDPNDLPLSRFQFDLNQNILSGTWQSRPRFFDDIERDLRSPHRNDQLSRIFTFAGEAQHAALQAVAMVGDSHKAATASKPASGVGESSPLVLPTPAATTTATKGTASAVKQLSGGALNSIRPNTRVAPLPLSPTPSAPLLPPPYAAAATPSGVLPVLPSALQDYNESSPLKPVGEADSNGSGNGNSNSDKRVEYPSLSNPHPSSPPSPPMPNALQSAVRAESELLLFSNAEAGVVNKRGSEGVDQSTQNSRRTNSGSNTKQQQQQSPNNNGGDGSGGGGAALVNVPNASAAVVTNPANTPTPSSITTTPRGANPIPVPSDPRNHSESATAAPSARSNIPLTPPSPSHPVVSSPPPRPSSGKKEEERDDDDDEFQLPDSMPSNNGIINVSSNISNNAISNNDNKNNNSSIDPSTPLTAEKSMTNASGASALPPLSASNSYTHNNGIITSKPPRSLAPLPAMGMESEGGGGAIHATEGSKSSLGGGGGTSLLLGEKSFGMANSNKLL